MFNVVVTVDICSSLYHLTLFSQTLQRLNVTICYRGGYHMSKLKSYFEYRSTICKQRLLLQRPQFFWNLNLAAVVLGLAWNVWKKKSFLGNVTYTQPQWGWHNCPPQESVQLNNSNEKCNEKKTNEDIWL